MGILPVAQGCGLHQGNLQILRQALRFANGGAQIRGYRGIVGRHVMKGFGGQAAAVLRSKTAGRELFGDPAVVRRVDNHRHGGVILGGGPQHGGPADVDVFQRFFQTHIGTADSLPERIKVYHHHIDRVDMVLLQLVQVVG